MRSVAITHWSTPPSRCCSPATAPCASRAAPAPTVSCSNGALDPEEVLSAANEALQRLQGGQPELAVSPLCGTNIAVAGMLAAATAIIALTAGSRRGLLPNAFIASMFAVIAAQPVGRAVQQHLTTCADLEGVAVVGVRDIVGELRKVQTSGAQR